MKRQTWKSDDMRWYPDEEERKPYHFFASSISGGRSGTDIEKVIRLMKKESSDYANSFHVYYVPLPEDASYNVDIHALAPLVDGSIYLGSYEKK